MEPVSTILRDNAEALPDKRDRSIVERAERIFYHGRPTPADAVPPVETHTYPDGYRRLSPLQPYRVPEGYYRRLAWKVALYAVAGVLLVLLILALLKRKLLRF